MYLVKIQIRVKGYKPMTFQGVLSEEGCKKIKVEELKKIAVNNMIKSFYEANKGNLKESDLLNTSAKLIEFKKRRCDFCFNINK